MIKLVSFDLQGTLSDASFSDRFWLEKLPELYAEAKKCDLISAKQDLKHFFKNIGPYDYRYYSVQYWLQELRIPASFDQIISQLGVSPTLFPGMMEQVKQLHQQGMPLIVLSSTTQDFIQLELGENVQYFRYIFSSLDDWHVAGKPPKLFRSIANHVKLEPQEILHIGDHLEQDIANAKQAGWHTQYIQPRKAINIFNVIKEKNLI